ncbi:MAG: tyrosine-type recombinase/integrase [Oenococcus sp.]|uniref:tyrosine-type recombinase/integrase n=1 Tax=Oenococcus sp. TaxID=1979414 RepID=UPI0039ED3220
MASILKKGKVWNVRVSYKDPITGKYRTRNKNGFLTKPEAETWVGLVRTGKDQERQLPDYLLSDYFEHWFKTYKADRSNQSQNQYRNTLSVIKKYLPTATLQTFTRDQFQAFLNEYGQDHSKETMEKRKSQLAASLKDAYAEGKITRDPTLRLNLVSDPTKTRNPDLKFLERSEVKAIVDYCRQNLMLDNFLIITGLFSGARFGELRALQDSDIHVKKHTISISKSVDGFTGLDKETKNKQSHREILMSSDWFNMYAAYTHTGSRLFDITSNGINKYLKQLCARLQIKSVTFHALRHTHASILLANDVSMQYVSERLGHANLAITEKVYSHLLADKRKADEAKINTIF